CSALHRSHPPPPRTAHPPSSVRPPPPGARPPRPGARPPPSGIRPLPFGICHLPSAICHLPFAIRLLAFPISRSEFLLPHFPKGFERPHQLAVPGGLVAAVPLECRAAIQRRAVVPLVSLVGRDFLMLGQQPL